ncbi:MAG: membrane protein insertase YidC [Vicinamibacterales bacterium]
MERRVLIAVFLSFLVLYGYQALFVPPVPPASQTSATSTRQESRAQESAAVLSTDPTASTTEIAAEPPLVKGDLTEREIVVETATVQAVLSNRGGRVVHWRLKKHLDDRGQPVDLVPSDVPQDQPSPFSLRVEDEGVTRRLNSSLYSATGDTNGRLDATANPATLVFEMQDAVGVRARKEFRFEPSDYVVAFSVTVVQGDEALNPVVLWGPGLGDIGSTAAGGSFFTGNYVQPPQAIFYKDNEVTRVSAGSLAEQPLQEGQFRFVGIDDHYFLAAALAPGQARVELRELTLPGAGETQRQLVTQTFRFAKPPQNVRFFLGPKQFDLLKSIDGELVRAINFGMFAWLVLPLLSVLKWLYAYVGNYGTAIILLTILINIVIFPLRHKSVVSMRKMQMLQPQLKAIQDRYAGLKVTDPAKQKMNTEVMNLYREKGVNPASGCVPMLLTMPVLFAFYSLLSQAIELRGAPFGFWIHDLSQKDPFYVTPLLMGASMFWQQRITPTTMDPAQAKMMMFMPVVFTAMFINFPSGLAIYYFTSNLWTIGQQYFTNWLIGPPAAQAIRPPAEKRLKSAGAGRTPGAEPKAENP